MSATTNRPAPPDDAWHSGWRLTYTQGSWLALAGPSAAVVLQPASAQWSELIGSIWEDVLAADGIEDLLGRMAAFRLEGMPSFGALFWGPDGVRSLVRGTIRLVDADTGAVLLDGEGVQTWTEGALAGHPRVRVSTGPDPDRAGSRSLELPLIVGAAGVTDLLVETAPDRQVSSEQFSRSGAQPAGASEPAGGPAAAPAIDPESVVGPDSRTESLDPVDPVEVPVRASADDALDRRDAEPSAPGWDPSLDGHTLIAPSLPGTPPVPGPNPAAEPATAPWPAPDVDRSELDESEHGHTLLTPHLPGGPQLPQPPQIRTVAALLRPSSGGQVEVDRTVLIGRAPSANRVSSGQLPRLLTVPSPSHDISRTHLQVAPGDGLVLVTDMNSTNGTVVITADGRRVTLEPSTPHPLEPGGVIDLGDGITIMVEPPATEPLPTGTER